MTITAIRIDCDSLLRNARSTKIQSFVFVSWRRTSWAERIEVRAVGPSSDLPGRVTGDAKTRWRSPVSQRVNNIDSTTQTIDSFPEIAVGRGIEVGGAGWRIVRRKRESGNDSAGQQ